MPNRRKPPKKEKEQPQAPAPAEQEAAQAPENPPPGTASLPGENPKREEVAPSGIQGSEAMRALTPESGREDVERAAAAQEFVSPSAPLDEFQTAPRPKRKAKGLNHAPEKKKSKPDN